MIRLLTTGLSNTASGTRSMMMNWYRYMDRDKIQYDFLVRPDSGSDLPFTHHL